MSGRCLLTFGLLVYLVGRVPASTPSAPGEAILNREQQLAVDQVRLRLQRTSDETDAVRQDSIAAFRADLRSTLAGDVDYVVRGRDRFLFPRVGLTYLLDEKLMPAQRSTPDDPPAEPFDMIVDFDRQLKARGIDLIYIPIPCKAEIYPEFLSDHAPADRVVSPQLTEFMLALTEADVEVVDLRAAFLAARDRCEEPLFPLDEVHWGTCGIQAAAQELARRLRRYDFATPAGGATDSIGAENRYTSQPIVLHMRGNLSGRLTEAEQAEWPVPALNVVQVRDAEGKPYRDAEEAPVLVMGDSFTMWYAEVGGGLAAQLALQLQTPITDLPSKGGGGRAPRVLAAKGPNYLKGRRVLIWAMVSRYLSDEYLDTWNTAKLPTPPDPPN